MTFLGAMQTGGSSIAEKPPDMKENYFYFKYIPNN
jgi:hypothetical protein